MAALSSVSFAKQSHRALVLIADPGMEAAVSPHAAPSPAPQHFPPTEGRFLRGTQLLTLVQGHRETFNRFPLLVFQHLVQAIRDILGPPATIVYEVVSKEMGADSTVAAHMVLQDVGAYRNIVTPNQKPAVTHRMLCQAGPPTSLLLPARVQAASSTCATQSSATRGVATLRVSAASSMWTTYCSPLTRQRPPL